MRIVFGGLWRMSSTGQGRPWHRGFSEEYQFNALGLRIARTPAQRMAR